VSSSPAGMENTSAITTRFIKSANYKNPQNSIGFKLKFFRSKSSKEIPISPATLRRSSILDGGGFSIYGQGSISQPHGGKLLTGSSAVFNMRYKSMTNLVKSFLFEVFKSKSILINNTNIRQQLARLGASNMTRLTQLAQVARPCLVTQVEDPAQEINFQRKGAGN